jgi:hypothetical protein
MYYIVCIMFKIIAVFITTLCTRLYVRVDVLLIWGKNYHDHITSLRGRFMPIKQALPRHLLLKCRYKARQVCDNVFVYRSILLRYTISQLYLELFRHCGICIFHFLIQSHLKFKPGYCSLNLCLSQWKIFNLDWNWGLQSPLGQVH